MTSLKQEPYFGMGKMAVSWHHDENLVERSTVAVYSYSCEEPESREKKGQSGRDPAVWHVALKVAWDIETPGLALPLYQGDCYFMLDDMNLTHQHCVLAGQQPRFSSTHRVAECSQGTLPYILGRCSAALDNLHSDDGLGCPALKSLDVGAIKQVEEIHNEERVPVFSFDTDVFSNPRAEVSSSGESENIMEYQGDKMKKNGHKQAGEGESTLF
ncbi:hypothetical protein JRQ81_006171 [Phrynocephalus forsythii]|uniref:Alpha-ketoglutarate-dependent dioxygenase FTO catalytic domain-containing protein n=1 Tax=Phrynocephalus forsythii TaxID=171643 RepID=A0A9Q0XG92_9SAUR|nr:hypothetical protein JRQ81_006171 [Phrynocephalus forsythii]